MNNKQTRKTRQSELINITEQYTANKRQGTANGTQQQKTGGE